MIWVALGIILGIVLTICMFHDIVDRWSDVALALFVGTLLCTTFGMLGIGVALIVGSVAPKEYVLYTQVPLAALQKDDGNKRLYINSRYTADGSLEYIVDEDLGNEAYTEYTLWAYNHVTIYEDEESHPYLRQFNQQIQGSSVWLYAIDPTKNQRFELHVPKGSISQGQ